jgi:hypothetical protein
MKRILWWICLLLAPAVLIALELFHPANFTAQPGMYQYLSQAEPHAADHQARLFRPGLVGGAAYDPDADGRAGRGRPAADGRRRR